MQTCPHGVHLFNPWSEPCAICVPPGQTKSFVAKVTDPVTNTLVMSLTHVRMPQWPSGDLQQEHIANQTVMFLKNEGYLEHRGQDGVVHKGEYEILDVRVVPVK